MGNYPSLSKNSVGVFQYGICACCPGGGQFNAVNTCCCMPCCKPIRPPSGPECELDAHRTTLPTNAQGTSLTCFLQNFAPAQGTPSTRPSGSAFLAMPQRSRRVRQRVVAVASTSSRSSQSSTRSGLARRMISFKAVACTARSLPSTPLTESHPHLTCGFRSSRSNKQTIALTTLDVTTRAARAGPG